MTRRPLIDFALGFLLGVTVFLLIAAIAHGAVMRLDHRRLTQGPDPMGPYARPCARSCVGTVCIGSRDGHTVCSLPPGSAAHGYRHRQPPR